MPGVRLHLDREGREDVPRERAISAEAVETLALVVSLLLVLVTAALLVGASDHDRDALLKVVVAFAIVAWSGAADRRLRQ